MEDTIESIRQVIATPDESKASEVLTAFIHTLDAATPSRTRTLVLEFRELGGSKLLREYFQAYPHDGPAANSACLLISMISATSSGSSTDNGGAVQELHDEGVLPALLQLFEFLLQNSGTEALSARAAFKACLIALSSISSCKFGASVLCGDAHCIGRVLGLIDVGGDVYENPVLLAHCINILANAIYLCRASALERIGDSGTPAVRPLIKTIEHFPENGKLCVLTLQALSYLVHNSGGNNNNNNNNNNKIYYIYNIE